VTANEPRRSTASRSNTGSSSSRVSSAVGRGRTCTDPGRRLPAGSGTDGQLYFSSRDGADLGGRRPGGAADALIEEIQQAGFHSTIWRASSSRTPTPISGRGALLRRKRVKSTPIPMTSRRLKARRRGITAGSWGGSGERPPAPSAAVVVPASPRTRSAAPPLAGPPQPGIRGSLSLFNPVTGCFCAAMRSARNGKLTLADHCVRSRGCRQIVGAAGVLDVECCLRARPCSASRAWQKIDDAREEDASEVGVEPRLDAGEGLADLGQLVDFLSAESSHEYRDRGAERDIPSSTMKERRRPRRKALGQKVGHHQGPAFKGDT